MKKLDLIFLPKPSGLYNTGSICYFNSLLQVLLSCTSLYDWKNKKQSDLGNEFRRLFVSDLDPNLSSKILKKIPKFGNGQESASEALTLLLNNINDPELNNMFTHRFRYHTICLNCNYKTEELSDTSILLELFDVTTITPEIILYHTDTLYDYTCDKCKKKGIIRKSRLTMLPEIIVCLFNVYYKKIKHNFPELLIFPGYNNKLQYNVVGQIEHSGSLHGGHYWSRALRENGLVYLFNDYSYNKSLFEPTENTYMVIYHLASIIT